MSQLGGGHLGYDPYSPAHVSPVVLRPRPWTKPCRPPTLEQFRRWIADTQTEDIAREIYDGLVCESGRAMCEMAVAVAKLSKATVVDFAAVTTPVLAMKAEYDRVIPSGGVRRPQPGISTAPTSRFPAPTTWCFQERRYPSPWVTLTTGLLGITCSPLPSCPGGYMQGCISEDFPCHRATVGRAGPRTS